MKKDIVAYKLNDNQVAILTLQLENEIDDFALCSTNEQIKEYVKGILTACYLTYDWRTYEVIETIINNHMKRNYDMYIII